MATAGLVLNQSLRVKAYMDELRDIRELPGDLIFSNRLRVVPAEDGEIMGYFQGNFQIADLVADDAAAATYDWGTMSFETTSSPNIKMGINYTASQIKQLRTMSNQGVKLPDGRSNSLREFQQRNAEGLLLGYRWRRESLAVAMHLDGFSYNRLGIKMDNVSWGMPSRLQTTLTGGRTWDNAATAKPVTDITTLRMEARMRYGVIYDRLTMSVVAFDYMTATTEFQDKMRQYLAPNVSIVNLNLLNRDDMKQMALRIIGDGIREIVLYDSVYWSKGASGVETSYRFLPVTKVVLDSIANDNNTAVQDIASGEVTESVMADFVGGNLAGLFNGIERGPVSYITAPPEMNPARATQWIAGTEFPRRHKRAASAVLTVGTYADPIELGA